MRALVVAVLLVPALALAEECKELRALDDQIQRQIQIAKSEPVQAIRKGIDEYLRGCRSSCRMLEPGAVADLGELDLAYLKSKFSLYLGDRFLGGGFMFTIVFQDRPDALFNAWVRQYPELSRPLVCGEVPSCRTRRSANEKGRMRVRILLAPPRTEPLMAWSAPGTSLKVFAVQ